MSKSFLIPFSLVVSGSALMIIACQNFQKPSQSAREQADLRASISATPQATPARVSDDSTVTDLPLDEAVPAGSVAVTAASPDSLVGLQNELKRVKRCLYTIGTPEACAFESSDPQEWPIEISKSLIAELGSLHKLYTTGGGSVQGDQNELNDIAREFLKYPDDNVQLAALKVAELLPPDKDVAKAIMHALDQSISAQLFGEGIDQLYKMDNVLPSDKLDQLLVRGITRHSAEVADMIARRSLTFLTDKNIEMFTGLANTLSPRSEAYRDLKSNIAQFHRLQAGG